MGGNLRQCCAVHESFHLYDSQSIWELDFTKTGTVDEREFPDLFNDGARKTNVLQESGAVASMCTEPGAATLFSSLHPLKVLSAMRTTELGILTEAVRNFASDAWLYADMAQARHSSEGTFRNNPLGS